MIKNAPRAAVYARVSALIKMSTGNSLRCVSTYIGMTPPRLTVNQSRDPRKWSSRPTRSRNPLQATT